MAAVVTGLARIAAGDGEAVKLVAGRRVGLLAHAASVDSDLAHARDVLLHAGAHIEALFGPEHGTGGAAQDMVPVPAAPATPSSAVRPRTYSLYGNSEADLSPRPGWLEGLDAVIVDLQDVGSRYYTYVWTAALMLRAAAAAGVQTVVLDRPNPLDGEHIEGAPQRPGYRSFVGLYDVPIRHAMTLAEILTMVVDLEQLDPSALTVVPMEGWSRAMNWHRTGLSWVMPSPNMPTLRTARVYPGACLLEGTLLSEGRGTTRPFEIFGAPWLDGAALAREVGKLPGVTLRPLSFEPTFQKHAGVSCGGVQLHVTDYAVFEALPTYVRCVAAAKRLVRDRFAWRAEAYEFVTDRPAIDLLNGGPELRECIDAGAPVDEVLAMHQAGAREFAERRRPWLRY